jgi:hypothetical protein
MYFRIQNKDTLQQQTVSELTDFLWQENWRLVRELLNSEVNIHEVDEYERQNSLLQYGF